MNIEDRIRKHYHAVIAALETAGRNDSNNHAYAVGACAQMFSGEVVRAHRHSTAQLLARANLAERIEILEDVIDREEKECFSNSSN